jgi:hypothetical protein
VTLIEVQYYDPRVWVREGEKTLTARVKEACADLGNVGQYRLVLFESAVTELCCRPSLKRVDERDL